MLPLRSVIRQAATINTQHRLLSTEATTSTLVSTSNTVQSVVTPSVVVSFRDAADEPDQLYSKLEIELKGNDPAVLKSYSYFANTAATHLGIEAGKR